MRITAVIGNWKMYKTVEEGLNFLKALPSLPENPNRFVGLAVPFTAIRPMAQAAASTKITIGAQNMHDATEGAFTGEIAATMLVEAGAKFVLLGHSERRRIFGETNAFIQRKVMRAFKENLKPVLCVGETIKEREAGQTIEVLRTQLQQCLADISANPNFMIAYEPVWAIGTGLTATPEAAQEAHRQCRQCMTELWGEEIAAGIPILYGGSVKPENAKNLLDQTDIDGLLVGGASLSIESFSQILTNIGL